MKTPQSLASFDRQRAGIASEIAALGDLRSGSVTPTPSRYGKPNCHCHQLNDPGHGP